MPETDEIQAINFAERIRAQCDRWLAAGAISTRVAIGWACPTAGSDLYRPRGSPTSASRPTAAGRRLAASPLGGR